MYWNICYSPLKDFYMQLKKSAWMRFKPTITYFSLDVLKSLSYHTISLTQSQLYRATLISSLVQCSNFISAIAFVCLHICRNQNFRQVITWVRQNELIHMVLTTGVLAKIAIENWPEWDVDPRPLNYMSIAGMYILLTILEKQPISGNYIFLLQVGQIYSIVIHQHRSYPNV